MPQSSNPSAEAIATFVDMAIATPANFNDYPEYVDCENVKCCNCPLSGDLRVMNCSLTRTRSNAIQNYFSQRYPEYLL